MTKTVRRLINLFEPSAYQLNLDLTKQAARTFSGSVVITGHTPALAGEIVLHSKDLQIKSATVDGVEVATKAGEDDELILSHPQLLAGEHTVELHFSGEITDPMRGLYPCYFTEDEQAKELLATQLESHYAREVFPCVDEPAAKATFDLTLSTKAGQTVIANTPVKSSQAKGDATITTFETTPKMSPYLLAFVAGELAYKETTTKNGVLVRTYATPNQVQHTGFALELAAKTLDFFDEYFALPYPLAKCDLVALPDFAAGGMENWGLMTFRESCMLVDPQNTPADMKERIATIICHEVAHQWFGDLVTMKWWDDLWLNESFANWIEYFAVDHFFPEWNVWQTFNSGEQQSAFSRDGLASVQVVRATVNHPDELHSLFDPAIVYAKGACLIRMLQDYLGADTFRDGLRVYMKRHAYGNAEADDLWIALGEVSGKDVKAFMTPWLEQPGHPVVSVASADGQLLLSQKRFYSNPAEAKNDGALWPLPLLSEQVAEALLTAAKMSVATPAEAPLINKNHAGFYHVQYSPALQEALAKNIARLSVADRQGLLIDGLALAKAGLSSTAEVMKLLTHYKDESSYAVWESITSVIGTAKLLINDDPAIKPDLQRYVAKLATPQFDRLGWERKPGESYFDELLRPTAIGLLAYARVPEVTQRCLAMFDAAQKPEDIALPEMRSIVYSVASRERGEGAYQKLLGWYKTASADERTSLIAGISSMQDKQLAAKATKLFTSKTIKPQDVDYWFVYFMRGQHTKTAAWEWLTTNWGWVKEQFDNTHDYPDFPKYAAMTMSTPDELANYKRFFEPKLNEPNLAMTIHQGIEDIGVRISWRERDLVAVKEFLSN